MKEKIKQAKEVADGYKNFIKSRLGLSSQVDEAVFKARRNICNACEHRTESDRCGLCGCPLSKKTKSLISHCEQETPLW